MKQIKILIIIIIILAIIFGIKIFTKKTNDNEMKIEQLKELVNSSKKINNYTCKYEIGEIKYLKKIKENNIKMTASTDEISEIVYYINSESGECFSVSEEKKIASFQKDFIDNRD